MVSGLLESTDDDEDSEDGDEHLCFALYLIATLGRVRKTFEDEPSRGGRACKDFARIFRTSYPDLRLGT